MSKPRTSFSFVLLYYPQLKTYYGILGGGVIFFVFTVIIRKLKAPYVDSIIQGVWHYFVVITA